MVENVQMLDLSEVRTILAYATNFATNFATNVATNVGPLRGRDFLELERVQIFV